MMVTLLLGETLAVGATPVPDTLIVCGVSMVVIVPVGVPVVGVKVTVIWQLPPGARLDPQLFVSAN